VSKDPPSSLAALARHLPDEAATEALARALAARLLPPAAPGGRIYLQGELGAGKTAFARALLRTCGVSGRIKSPSYALLESYKVSNLYFYHFDFYRFGDSREWLDAGFRELLQADAVALIEWPERAGGLLPQPDLRIALSYAEPGRDALLTAHSARGLSWLNALAAQDSTHAPQPPPAGA
jgi:tRNA threonylcarbamoyladenosine biosynthesis protein TsaE